MPLNDEKFEALLRWLNSNREIAAEEYEAIRKRLIGMFTANGLSNAEALADETIDRVADRLADIEAAYEGPRVRYFRGVARNIIFEELRRKEIATDTLPERPTRDVDVSEEYTCLLRCLKFLKPKDRDFILDYHVYDGAEKIINHLVMAEELGISVTYLRVKAHRARISLEKCVLDCVERLRKK